MEKLDIYNKGKAVPDEAKKPIVGGRLKGMTDINPMWRIKLLTELFGPCGIGWYYTPVNKWMERSGDEIAAFVDIELYIKYENEWSRPICGTGGSKFISKEQKGLFMSDECYKMATTDAIGVACKQLGIGADVYWAADVTKYTVQEGTSGKQKTDPQNKATEPAETPWQPEPATPPKPANAEQITFLENYCKGKKLDLERLLVFNNVTREVLTEQQALSLYEGLIKKYGE